MEPGPFSEKNIADEPSGPKLGRKRTKAMNVIAARGMI
jgi:hypothetical protein